MSRRLEIELTSQRDDGTHTWRKAGAREPKGIVTSSLLPEGSAIGDVLKAEAEFFMDGIEITSIVVTSETRTDAERLELLGSGDDVGGVTTVLVGRRGGRGRDFDDDGRGGPGRGRGDNRGGRGGRGEGRGGGRAGEGRGAGRGGDARGGEGRGDRPPRQRAERPERPPAPSKPKAKRLRPRREHRNAVLASLPEIQKPIAEQLLRGGVPEVRKLIDELNQQNREAGRPEIEATPLIQLADDLLPKLKAAEWHDRATAALAGIDEVDLRDLRSVVVAAESAARNEEARSLAQELRDGLAKRVEDEHSAWLQDISESLTDDRTVRALRMSSRPPKAGAPLPPDLAGRLAEAAAASLTAETGPQRWGTVLDAVAFSPVRSTVQPQGIPARPNDELLETVKRLSTRVPHIAALFGIEPVEPARKRRRTRRRGDASPKAEAGNAEAAKPKAPKPKAPKAETSESRGGEAAVADPRVAPEPVVAEASVDQAVVDIPTEAHPPEAHSTEAHSTEAPTVHEAPASEAAAAPADTADAEATATE